ncbi:CCAAT/enhancer-binding protein alpha [Anolis carolinensis]|uniref:CCAAT/enhancer-binding protein alpha n=1 Tax=Anolis carolinensis TaxID=28377 RepID=UPI002F2B6433
MERLPGPFFEAEAPLPPPHHSLPHPPPHQHQPFLAPPPPAAPVLCEHETSIDLSAYLDPGAFHDELLAELFQQQRGLQNHQNPPYPGLPCKEAMPAGPHAGYGGLYAEKMGFHGGFGAQAVRVKQEPHEEDEDEEEEEEQQGLVRLEAAAPAPLYSQAARCAQTTMLLLPQPTPPPTPGPPPAKPAPHPPAKKALDKGSREYRLRRERNNVAVRKSRDKAKLRHAETQQKVLELSGDNERLRKRVEQLGRELQALRGLLRHLPDGQLLSAMGARA